MMTLFHILLVYHMEASTTKALGCPLPFDDHAVSVSLPKWADVVGYEEGDPNIVTAMKSGYPRFRLHSSVALLNEVLLQRHNKVSGILTENGGSGQTKWSCFPFPTIHVANRFRSYLIKAIHLCQSSNGGDRKVGSAIVPEESVVIEAVGFLDVHAVFFPTTFFSQGKAFWQHTGEVLSSRHAENTLCYLGVDLPDVTLAVHNNLHSDCGSRHHKDSEQNGKSDSRKISRTCASDAITAQCRLESNTHANQCDSHIKSTTDILKGNEVLGVQAIQTVRNRIASLLSLPEYIDQPASHAGIILTLCGMASISTALRLVQAHFQQNLHQPIESGEMVVFGFPYLDTLKLTQRAELNPGGVHFFGNGDETDLDQLEALLQQKQKSPSNTKKIWAVFTECPSNPLLKCPNLIRLSHLARTYGFLVVVDDTIGSFCNIDLLHPGPSNLQVDLLCTSLTKIFSGVGDAFAGSLVINPCGPYASQLRTLAPELLLPSLYYSDAIVLEQNSRDYPQRAHRINQTTERLVTWLSTHPCAERVFYPTLDATSHSLMTSFHRSPESMCDELKQAQFQPGYGCLFSLVLKEHLNTEAFFDALDVCKGPSLGTNFTLACPYTLLAHYTELPWAEQFGVSRRLVRVSVGLEDFETLLGVFENAFVAAGCKPKS